MLRCVVNALSSSSRNIGELKYRQYNQCMIPKALSLQANKQRLAQHIKSLISQISGDLNSAQKRFQQVQSNTKDLNNLIKKQILIEDDPQLDPSFIQRSHYYFTKEGKKIRPIMIMMLAENFKTVIKKQNPHTNFYKIDSDIKKWCAQIQIMHIASLAHDDIVDDSPSRRGQQSQHLKYGSKIAVFSGNYVISKASKSVSEFNSPRLYEIYAQTMSNLAEGEIKQLIAKSQNKFVNEPKEKLIGFDRMMDRYMEKSFFKSAALMCGSLVGVPTIFELQMGNEFEKCMEMQMDQIQQMSFRTGQHYGLALQLIDDILDYISTAEEMGKQEMADLVQGNITAPVYLTYRFKPYISQSEDFVNLLMLNKKKKSKQDAKKVKEWVDSGVGIEYTYVLGALHVLEGLKELLKFKLTNDDVLGWRYLGYKLMTRRT